LDKRNISKTFDEIARGYDRLNRILSFGIDVGWRKSLRSFLPEGKNLRLLDLATGTGDQILCLMKRTTTIESAVGLDLSNGMLEIGRKKIAREKFHDKVQLIEGDATLIPFSENSFDVVTMSFGIRNVENVEKCLCEIHRVLKPNGKALILELSLPGNFVVRSFYLLYFRHCMPFIAGLLTGDKKSYRYLVDSTESFFLPEEFICLMKAAGLSNTKARKLSFGIAYLYQGNRC